MPGFGWKWTALKTHLLLKQCHTYGLRWQQPGQGCRAAFVLRRSCGDDSFRDGDDENNDDDSHEYGHEDDHDSSCLFSNDKNCYSSQALSCVEHGNGVTKRRVGRVAMATWKWKASFKLISARRATRCVAARTASTTAPVARCRPAAQGTSWQATRRQTHAAAVTSIIARRGIGWVAEVYVWATAKAARWDA